MSNKLLDSALNYAEEGWKVFPCKPESYGEDYKSPHYDKNDLEHGKDNATRDQAQIRSWWARWPDALIGVNCEPSGIFALDIDNKHGKNGSLSYTQMVDAHGNGKPPEIGPAQRTPSGGYHLIFKHPPEEIKSKKSKLGPGLDLQSKAYIILAPSPGYQWIDGHGLDAELTEVPEWLLERIRNLDRRPKGEAVLTTTREVDAGQYWLTYYLSQAYAGNRNDQGFHMAIQLRDSGIPESEAESLMIQYAERAPGGDHPYTESEARASLKSAYNGTRREPAILPGLATAQDGRKPAKTAQPAEPENAGIKDLLLYQPTDHEGHAQCVNALHKGIFAYSQHLGWMHYNKRFWQRDNAELQAERAIVNTLQARRAMAVEYNQEEQFENLIKKTAASSFNVNGTKKLLSSLVAVDVSDFDSDPDLLNVKNGVLDLRTGELQPHSRDQKFTYCLPVDFDPDADYDRWFQFLLEATSFDESLVELLKQAVGYSLTGHTWEEILFYIFGPARAGKGTFTETLIHMMGNKPISTESSFETFTADRYGDTQNFDLAPLKPCRFVAASESNKKQPLNPAKIKQLTGGNFIYCAHKHREHFSYRPQFKIWLSSNHPANVDTDDDAAWSRVKVIEFPISRVGHEDKSLKRDLAQDENLRGVLRWAVEGAREWYDAENGLEFPKSIDDATKAQRESQDFIQQFLTEETTESLDSWVHTGALWESYKRWCDSNGVPAKYQNQFSIALKAKGFEFIRKRNSDNKQFRAVKGIKMTVTGDAL